MVERRTRRARCDSRIERSRQKSSNATRLHCVAKECDRRRRLRLVFTCCHPALALEAQVALTLRTVVRLPVLSAHFVAASFEESPLAVVADELESTHVAPVGIGERTGSSREAGASRRRRRATLSLRS